MNCSVVEMAEKIEFSQSDIRMPDRASSFGNFSSPKVVAKASAIGGLW